MVTDIIESTQDVSIGRHAMWAALIDPRTYLRLFAGIGGCEFLQSDSTPTLLFRVGTVHTGVSVVRVQLIVGRWYDGFELYCPASGSLASVRLRTKQDRTRVTVTFLSPGRVHPVVAAAPNSAVVAWLRAGLQRIVERCAATPNAVLSDSAATPVIRQLGVVRQLVSTGVIRPRRPDHGLKQMAGLAKWGLSLAGGYAAAAACTPERVAVIDNSGQRTFAEVHSRSDAFARALTALGLRGQHSAGLLARNHAGMLETMVAAGKVGLDLILLNAGLSGRQLEDIAQRERLSALFVDGELESLVRYLHPGICRFTTDARPPSPERTTIEDLVVLSPGRAARATHPGRLIVLTSGTSGMPKGARRPHLESLDPVAAVLARIPLRMEEKILIASPLFHTWGLGMLQLSTALRATVVLEERFDAEQCLRLIAEHRIDALVVVPTMLQRILDLPAAVRARYDTSTLRVVACGGAPLPGAAVLRFIDAFGDILYNVYGSTEVSWATIATPEDLRAAPATVGRPPAGTRVAVLGPDLRPVAIGTTGRIFVGNHMLFDGYVNAAPPTEANGMLDTGDVGYIDAAGRLFIDGRGDEMIISGGEKLFPRPVEEALEHLPQVREAAVVGVADPEFGQRVVAFVVKREGAGLDSQMVRDYIRNRLGRVAVPRDVSFLPSLPRGETGKIIKRFLVAPDPTSPQAP